MSYTVKFSDLTKSASALVIEDNVKDSDQTSLTFVGKNAAGYAEAISTNFLHLLENHASTLPPTNPIEGQLWFDTSNSNNSGKKLLINDGSVGADWRPINGIWQQAAQPEASSQGDLWVDTTNQQLKLAVDSNSWITVGPTIAGGLRSGAIAEQITDVYGDPHVIIGNYVDGHLVEIISFDTFIPQVGIYGFDIIKAGLNLTTDNGAILNATAYAAQNIFVTSPVEGYISGNSFVRNDISSSINGTLNVKDGITIGIDPTFQLGKEGAGLNRNIISNTRDKGFIGFKIINNDVSNEILTIRGENPNGLVTRSGRVGVNQVNPSVEFEVNGSALFSGSVRISTTASDALIIDGAATFGKSINLGSTATFVSTANFWAGLFVGTATQASSLVNPVPIIVPRANEAYSIGASTSSRFTSIYSKVFVGDEFSGTAAKALALDNNTLFSIDGDITTVLSTSTGQTGSFEYNGSGAARKFITELSPTVITNKDSVTEVSVNDEVLISVRPVDLGIYEPTKIGVGTPGSGATFTVYREAAAYIVTQTAQTNTGTDYQQNTRLLITGDQLGGVTPANDLKILITGVNGSGNITTFVGGFEGGGGNFGIPITGLKKADKQTFLQDIYDALIIPGTVMPFAGQDVASIPNNDKGGGIYNWLFCDGAYVEKINYPKLFQIIGYTYGKSLSGGSFRLPDLRGRMVVGFNNMVNPNPIGNPEELAALTPRIPGANKPLESSISGTVDGRVSGGAFTATAYSSTVGFGASGAGVSTSVMNPYLALNYIIKA
jgi:microcystin-dependent protein